MFEDEPQVDERARRTRTRTSAALLLVGSLAFVASMAMPAVTMKYGRMGVIHVEGWTCATNYGPTAATNGFLTLAFVFWAAAVWFRSRRAWLFGVAASMLAATYHPIIGAWPGYEGIQRLHSGYWTWTAATAVVCASFLVLPGPLREPGERLTVAEIDRGRAGLAWIFGGFATAVLVGSHVFLPTCVGVEWREGPPQPGDQFGWYTNGPTRSSMDPVTKTVPRARADGTTENVPYRHVEIRATVVELQLRRAGDTRAVELALLLLPLVFVAAATTRRRAWRWTGAAVAAAVTAACPFLDVPWPTSGMVPHPLAIVWWVTPALLLVAFVLLPPRGAAVSSSATRSSS